MSTPLFVGLGAVAAALTGRQLIRSGILGGKRAAQEYAKGGFKAKMDRKEAIAILGLTYVLGTSLLLSFIFLKTGMLYCCGAV